MEENDSVESTQKLGESAVQTGSFDSLPSPVPSTVINGHPGLPKEKFSLFKNKKVLVLLILFVVFCLIVTVWFVWFEKSTPKASENNQPQTTQTKPTPSPEVVNAQLAKFANPTTGETWLDKPVQIAKQGYFVPVENDAYSSEENTTYYHVGKRGDNTITMTATEGMGVTYQLFEKSPNGKVTFIYPDATAVYNEEQNSYLIKSIKPTIEISKDIHYDSLTIPDQISIDKKGSVVLKPTYPSLGSEYIAPYNDKFVSSNYATIQQYGKSTLMKSETVNLDTKLVSINYFIKTPLNTKITLRYEPLDLDLRSYQWQRGDVTDDSIHAITRGCGNTFATVTRSDALKDSDVVLAGKSKNGLNVYEFADSNNALLKKAYQEFKEYYSSDQDTWLKNMTIETFIKQHGVVLYKDVNGQWLVYVRDDLSPGQGCAKPVVYLYPNKEQAINVRIGADVKISDPLYNKKQGWNVIAKPNGEIKLNGQVYNSLFWEGLGSGDYPGITSGAVVKKQDAIKTIRQHLAMQGLNNQEIQDFVDYWQNKLPNKPYIRLTWFNTNQMNSLSPLYITPKPDTLIRVFLDASGLDEPINLPAQDLKPTLRLGFTVVEWGGLSGLKLF